MTERVLTRIVRVPYVTYNIARFVETASDEIVDVDVDGVVDVVVDVTGDVGVVVFEQKMLICRTW